MIDLICVKCCIKLTRKTNYLSCPECRKKVLIEDKIILYSDVQDFYYNIVGIETMHEYLFSIDRAGWLSAFYELQKRMLPQAKHIFKNVMNFDRSGWKFLMPIKKSANVLDLGAGWGNISLSLAHSCKEIVSLDLTKERLQSLKATADYLGLNNITYIHSSHDLRLPFADNQFDIVVINGVLEWIPERHQDNPRNSQVNYLKEVKRILKPQGALYIAIENRFSYTYLRKPEDHTGLKWCSLMPRFLSNIYSTLKRGKPYRTYTYSCKGYKRIFNDAGFRSYHFYSPIPDYRYPKKIIDIENSAQVNTEKIHRKKLKQKILNNSNFLRKFGHSFSIIVSPQDIVLSGFIDILLRQMENLLEVTNLRIQDYLIRSNVVILFCVSSERKRFVVRIPHNKRNAIKTHDNAKSLKQLEAFNDTFNQTHVEFPKLHYEGKVKDYYISVESYLSGSDIQTTYDKNPQAVISELLKFLILFGKKGPHNSEAIRLGFIRKINIMIDYITGKLVEKSDQEQFRRLGGLILENIKHLELQCIWTHGDFNLNNCLWDLKHSRLSGVIDWDQMMEYGLPGWDLLNLLIYFRRKSNNSSWGRGVYDMLECDWTSAELELWDRYTSELSISKKARNIILLTIWLKGLWFGFRSDYRFVNYEWVKTNVSPILNAFEQSCFIKNIKDI